MKWFSRIESGAYCGRRERFVGGGVQLKADSAEAEREDKEESSERAAEGKDDEEDDRANDHDRHDYDHGGTREKPSRSSEERVRPSVRTDAPLQGTLGHE